MVMMNVRKPKSLGEVRGGGGGVDVTPHGLLIGMHSGWLEDPFGYDIGRRAICL